MKSNRGGKIQGQAHEPGFIFWLLLIPGLLSSVAWLHAQPPTPAPVEMASVSFAPTVNYWIGGMPVAIAAGDFNGDSRIDLAVLRDRPGGLAILFGEIGGRFRPGETLPFDFWIGALSLATADLNGDGNLDLAITQAIPGAVRVFLGDGKGCFEAAEDYTFTNAPLALAVADFNRDAQPDLAFATEDAGSQIMILIGKGDGTWRPLSPQPVDSGAGSGGAGDFDGDGSPDLVLTNGGRDRLSLLIGQGDGTFLPERRVAAKDTPLGIACGDFNEDGKLDLVTANFESDSVSVILGCADGTFRTLTDYEAGNLPVVVASADLNGDGHLDLVVGHHQRSELKVLIGTGEGTFLGPLTYQAGAGVRSVIIADLDSDGRPDLATVNLYGKNVSVLMNRTEKRSAGLDGYPQMASAMRPAQGPDEPTGSGPLTPERSLSEYRIDTWTTDNGLPQNTVQCLLQTQDGYLWVGTPSGLARYDGLHFTVFDRNNTPALKSDNILCLAEGPDHTLWIGTSDGLVRWRNRGFAHFSSAAVSSEERKVWELHASRFGKVWIAAGGGLTCLGEDHPTRRLVDAAARSVLEDELGRLWLGGDSGLMLRPAGSTNWEEVLQTEAPSVPGNGAKCLCQDTQGNVWFGNGSGLWRWKDGRLKLYGTKHGLSPGIVSSIAPDGENGLWLAVGGHVNRFHAGQMVRYNSSDRWEGASVNCVYPDHEGNIWLGTGQDGLVRLAPRRLVTYTTRDGLIHNDVWSICQGPSGGVWMGTFAGVSQFADEKFSNLADLSKPVYQDRSGNLWAIKRSSLACLRGGQWETYGPDEWPLFYQVSSIYQDRSDAIWVAAGTGLWRLKDKECEFFATTGETNQIAAQAAERTGRKYVIHTNALPRSSPFGILEDHDGNLWVGSRGAGLHRLQDGRFTSLTTSNGLSSNFVGPLLSDPDGTLWIGSDKGLNRLKDGRVTRYTAADGLAENLVANLIEDDNGWFWTMGHQGIHRMLKRDLNDFAEGKRGRIQTISCGQAEGMLNSEGNVGVFPNTCQTADGRLWFPTTRGVVVIDPHRMETHESPPPVVIEQFLADDELIFGDGVAQEERGPDPASTTDQQAMKISRSPAPSPSRLRLAPGRARFVEFRYAANTFVAPEKVRFRYKLEGHDADWHEAGTRRAAFYTDLKPGPYRFRVLAVNHHGIPSASPAECAFFLTPHFYQTHWFHAASAVALLLGGLGMHRLRVGIIGRHQALEQQLALALQRERIARDMHDDLGASLTQIGLLSEHARRDPNKSAAVAGDVEKIAAAARQTAQAAEEIVWTVNPHHDTLDSLATYLCQFAREYLEPSSVRCRLDIPDVLPNLRVSSEVRHSLVLVVKEALNNAVKHSAARQISVGLSLEGDMLTVTVTDDGHGFDPQGRTVGSQPAGSGNGVANMRERIESVGGHFELRTHPEKGVSVRATVRLKG